MAVARIQLPQERYIWAIQRAGMTLETYQEKFPKSAIGMWVSDEKQPTLYRASRYERRRRLR